MKAQEGQQIIQVGFLKAALGSVAFPLEPSRGFRKMHLGDWTSQARAAVRAKRVTKPVEEQLLVFRLLPRALPRTLCTVPPPRPLAPTAPCPWDVSTPSERVPFALRHPPRSREQWQSVLRVRTEPGAKRNPLGTCHRDAVREVGARLAPLQDSLRENSPFSSPCPLQGLAMR